MERRRLFGVFVAILVIGAAACSGSGDVESADPSDGPTTQVPDRSPSTAISPSPEENGDGRDGTISLTNLTSGHSEVTAVLTTEPISPPPDTLILAHVMAFNPAGPQPPALSGNGLTWTLVGGNVDGEKRHFVYRAAGPDPSPGPVTIDFGTPTEILWVIDAAEGAATGDGGAEGIVQFVSHESQRNDTGGSIELSPFEDPVDDVVVAFALAGSGAASDIVPEDGYTETAEAENPGANLIISNFWRRGEDTSPSAVFEQDSGSKQIQSWLFLALELRPG